MRFMSEKKKYSDLSHQASGLLPERIDALWNGNGIKSKDSSSTETGFRCLTEACRGSASLIVGVLSLVGSLFFLIVVFGCSRDLQDFRPEFHYTPPANWMNDPNGLLYVDGLYHMYYQYNPQGNDWGHMSWGHAVSSDLLNWKTEEVVLHEEGLLYPRMVFSGSAVRDEANTSGLCKNGAGCVLSVYTEWTLFNQTQNIAVSDDGGMSFRKYEGNPVIDIGSMSFRDPDVFWHEPSGQWIMSVALPDRRQVRFYSSKNLKQWKYLSDFGPAGETSGIWECPDLIRMKTDDGVERWVLLVSVAETERGSFMQYFVGTFDGVLYTAENPDAVRILDNGFDFYAGITFHNLPSGHPPVLIGWVSNWDYADNVPTYPFRGAMSLPRSLHLRAVNGMSELIQRPIFPEANSLEMKLEKRFISPSGRLAVDYRGSSFEIRLNLKRISGDLEMALLSGPGGELKIGIDQASGKLYVDRCSSAGNSFDSDFQKLCRSEAPFALNKGEQDASFRIFVDRSVVEVFEQQQGIVLTNLVFPGVNDNGMELRVEPEAIHEIEIAILEPRSRDTVH